MTDKLKNECIKLYNATKAKTEYENNFNIPTVNFNIKKWATQFRKYLNIAHSIDLLNYKFSEEFLDKFVNVFDLQNIIGYQNVSEKFIKKHYNKIDFFTLVLNKSLSSNLLDYIISHTKYNDIPWDDLARKQKLSYEFIRKYHHKLDMYIVCKYQKLSESFISDFKNKLPANAVAKFQKLSESFIRKHKQYLIDENNGDSFIKKYQNISDKLNDELKFAQRKYVIPDFGLNWLYAPVEYKSNYIKKHSTYTIQNDKGGPFIIAWKGIRKDRYSNYNFQYLYLKGKTYECHCDCTNEENSFGLSAWTKTKATEYCDELVVQVKIYIKDIGRIVHGGGKIRCSKFKVLT